MSGLKDSTEVISAGPSCSIWLATVGTAYPATMAAQFASTAGWQNVGYLKVPPAWARAKNTTDLEVWNAAEPLATLLNSDVSTITLNPVQTNRLTFELYFGPLVYSALTGGIHIEPDPSGAGTEKALCVELIDGIVGGKVLRVGWRRATVGDVGNFNMDKADAVNYEMTLKRLVPASGSTYFIDSNILGLVSA